MISFREYSIFCIRRMWVDWPGMGLPIFPNPCFGPIERVFVWAAMEGYGRGTDPIVLLGWRVEYLTRFSIRISLIVILKYLK